MKNIYRHSAAIVLIIIVCINYSCKKEKPTPPELSTKAVSDISYTTATSGGEVTNEGGAPIVSRGVCWNTSVDPTISDSKTIESGGLGSFTSNITQLTPNTNYYIRAYATNSAGTSYGDHVTFTTSQISTPTLTTSAVTSISSTAATSGGTIINDNGASVTARGVCWSTNQNPTIANDKTNDASGTGTFISSITGLTRATTYFLRAYATNNAGTVYGAQLNFTTLSELPTITTSEISDVTTTTASSGGNVTNDGGAVITSRGICWSTSINPVTSDNKTHDGIGVGIFTSTITGLTPNTTYYVRAYVTNSVGTRYGNQNEFTTLQTGQIVDVDGNRYNTVVIGTQVWIRENLKTTKNNDGTLITNVTNGTVWNTLSTPGYCWNNNYEENKNPYGALYNWYAVNTGKLCPTGWHIPTTVEWTILTTYLGGTSIAGGKLKEMGEVHWHSPNTGATNESGFTALPGGHRSESGAFGSSGSYSVFWSATESDINNAGVPTIFSTSIIVAWNNFNKKNGLSVRCIKDN